MLPQYFREGFCDLMPLVSYSDGGYVQSGGEYYFIVGPAADTDGNNSDKKVKVGYHRQGDIMDNKEFKLPSLQPSDKQKLIQSMSHLRKDVKTGETAQSFETDQFILSKAKRLVEERFEFVDEDKVSLVMRCLYQNTPDKQFIVGFHKDDADQDIVIACGFNGGGFQMGPMIARLCVKLLMKNLLSAEELSDVLSILQEESNSDFNIAGLDIDALLTDMEEQFSPSRQSLQQFK